MGRQRPSSAVVLADLTRAYGVGVSLPLEFLPAGAPAGVGVAGVEGDVPREPAESGWEAAEPLSDEPDEASEAEASDDAAGALVGVAVSGLGPSTVSAVCLVEAAPLEHDADIPEHLADRPSAGRTDRERFVMKALDGVEVLGAAVAAVFDCVGN